MKTVLFTLAAAAAAGLAVAVAVVGLGLYNVSAQKEHLPGVSWVLHTTFRNSIKRRAPDPETLPDLSDPALAALGAGHYATACAPCHAWPGELRSEMARAMRPEPPPIREAVATWRAGELHVIVEHGVKMSGMPGWPTTGRGDEVWSVVAYLEAVKAGNAPAPPEAESDTGPPGADYCATCHGRIARHVPRLDILTADEIAGALRDYRAGTRPSGIMQQAASLVPMEAIPGLAAYFATRAAPTRPAAPPPPEGGATLAARGSREVPACIACHGPDAPDPAPDAPALAGQDRAYLATQLRLWRDGTRHGSEKMTAAARALSDGDIAALAGWYASLAPDGRPRP